nr:54s ribosomal protein img2, mitochondrial [Quercus suber]
MWAAGRWRGVVSFVVWRQDFDAASVRKTMKHVRRRHQAIATRNHCLVSATTTMSSTVLMPFLRPLGLPRPSTVRHFLRYASTETTKAAQGNPPIHKPPSTSPSSRQTNPPLVDPNLLASRTASATYPPASMKSLPRPKESRASHRSRHPTKQRDYPTRHTTHTPTERSALIPSPVVARPEQQCAPHLAYYVNRTSSKQLPIYLLRKRGGSLKLTQVRKIDGSAEALRDALRTELGLGDKEAVVNPITRHVVLKGHFKPQVQRFLKERLF